MANWSQWHQTPQVQQNVSMGNCEGMKNDGRSLLCDLKHKFMIFLQLIHAVAWSRLECIHGFWKKNPWQMKTCTVLYAENIRELRQHRMLNQWIQKKLTFPNAMFDSDLSTVTFLCASEPPYWSATLSPISLYISLSTRTTLEEGSRPSRDRIPITTSCCESASIPTVSCVSFVRSRQLWNGVSRNLSLCNRRRARTQCS